MGKKNKRKLLDTFKAELPNITNIIPGHRTKAAKLRAEKSLEAKGESAIDTTDKDSQA